MNYKLVIFDVDGLMLDTEAIWKEAWQMISEKYNAPDLGMTIFFKSVGRNDKEIDAIIDEDLRPYGDPHAIRKEVGDYGYKKLSEHIDLKPGLFELLDYLKTTPVKLAVATSTSRELTTERLTRLKLIHYFDYILCGNEVTQSKPSPEIYQKVIDKFQFKPDQALVLEDSFAGIEAAYNAHIPCIMIPDIILPEEKQRQQTIAVVKTLKDVIDILKK